MIIPANINRTNLEPMAISVASKCKVNANMALLQMRLMPLRVKAEAGGEVRRRRGDGSLHRRCQPR